MPVEGTTARDPMPVKAGGSTEQSVRAQAQSQALEESDDLAGKAPVAMSVTFGSEPRAVVVGVGVGS
jgi:hypothetical protein